MDEGRAIIYFDYGGTVSDEEFIDALQVWIVAFRMGEAKLTDFMIEADYPSPIVNVLEEMEQLQELAEVGVGD